MVGQLGSGEAFAANFTMSLGDKEILLRFDLKVPFRVLSVHIFDPKDLARLESTRLHVRAEVSELLAEAEFDPSPIKQVDADGLHRVSFKFPTQIRVATPRGFGWTLLIVED